MTSFARLLGAHRRRCDLSCNQLAHAVGVDPSYISRMESGDRGAPSAPVLRALMRVLRLDLDAQQRFALAATGSEALADWADAAADAMLHAATMRAANALLAACPCHGCTASRAPGEVSA